MAHKNYSPRLDSMEYHAIDPQDETDHPQAVIRRLEDTNNDLRDQVTALKAQIFEAAARDILGVSASKAKALTSAQHARRIDQKPASGNPPMRTFSARQQPASWPPAGSIGHPTSGFQAMNTSSAYRQSAPRLPAGSDEKSPPTFNIDTTQPLQDPREPPDEIAKIRQRVARQEAEGTRPVLSEEWEAKVQDFNSRVLAGQRESQKKRQKKELGESEPTTAKATTSSVLHMGSGGYFRQTSTEGKRKHGSDTDEEPTRKRSHATVVAPEARSIEPEARSIDFRQIQNPKRDYDCFIQVDQSEAYGSLASVIDGHGVTVFIDPGRSANPFIGLRFRYPGSDGYQVAKMDWEIGAKVGGQWVVEEFNYVLVKEVPQDIAVNHLDVLRACPEAVLPRLMCMTLVVTGQGQGYKRKDIGVVSEPFKACLETIINSRKRITLRIWFLVPVQFPGIDKKCLSVIRYLLDQRKEPFSGVSDANGVYLTGLLGTSKQGGKAQNTTKASKPLNMGYGDTSAVGHIAKVA